MKSASKPFGKPVENEEDDDFSVDLGVESDGPAPGIHTAKVVDIQKTVSKEHKKPMWEWTFVITEGEHAGTDRKLWTVLTPAAIWKVNETLAALGIRPEEDESTVKFGKKDIIGLGCQIELEESEYNGRKGTSIKRVLAHPKGTGFRAKKGPGV